MWKLFLYKNVDLDTDTEDSRFNIEDLYIEITRVYIIDKEVENKFLNFCLSITKHLQIKKVGFNHVPYASIPKVKFHIDLDKDS